jgi:type I restriction enzyme, S subunit
MRLEMFFEKFDQLADAPNAVAKIRELVLELAVQGKLVEQCRDDGSAETLLQKSYEEKVSLVNDGLLKRAEHIESPTDDLVGIEFPSQWRLAPLAALCVSVTDGDHLPPPKADTGVPFLVISDVRWGGIDFSRCRHVSKEYYDKLDWIRKPRESDILYTLVGSLGIPVVVRDSTPFCVQRHIGILRPSKHIELGYLAYALASKLVFRQATLIATGIAQKTVPLAGLRRITIPLPPLAEQKRIVKKADELMALCDRLETQQQERQMRHAALARASLSRFAEAPTPANLDFLFHEAYTIEPAELRRSILTLAVQGKLVSQDPNDEPATELLERLARNLSPEQRHRQAVPLSPRVAESLQYELPNGWTWARFRDVAIIASNLVKPNAFSDFIHLAPDNIEKGNGVLLPCATVREDKVISSNHRFYPGQIVYSKIRPNLAKVVVVDFEGLCSADMYPIDALIDVFFLQRYMLSESFLAQAMKTDTRVAMPKINQMELNAIAVPIPPIAEQRRIVAKVDQLMALVDQLETQLATSRTKAEKLMEAVVAELTVVA